MSAEKTYKNIANSINTFINTCISILKVLFLSKFGVKIPQTDAETCIVLGNGPSLKTSFQKHIDKISKQTLFCVNSFATTNEYNLLKPKYYIMLDDGFWKSEHDTVMKTFESMVSKTNWDIQLLVPQIAKKSKRFDELVSKNKHIHLTYFNYTVFKGAEGIAHYFYSKNMAMPQSQNVLVSSIFLAINAGFKKIIVLGADHSWHENIHVNNENIVCIKDVHFYDDSEQTKYVPITKGLHSTETFKFHELLNAWSKAFYGYWILKKYALTKNCTIENASPNSYIDAFKRIEL